jgi:hypothetical protein
MSRSPGPDPSNESPSPGPEPSRGLVDPRVIHPSPEGVFPDPVEVRPAEPDPNQRGPAADETPERQARPE